MDVVPEVRVTVELGVTAIDSPTARLVSAENVNDTVLDLLRDSREVHELP